MRKSLLSVAAAAMLVAGVGCAWAQADTPPPWSAEQGPLMMQNYTSMKYTSYRDTSMKPVVGMILPNAVQLYALPDTMKSPTADRYQYGMINDHPVVVETTTRKVVHTWN
jgi:hypothetical protein